MKNRTVLLLGAVVCGLALLWLLPPLLDQASPGTTNSKTTSSKTPSPETISSGTSANSGPDTTIDYHRDIQTIFNDKCVACHSCYDAACQLKLTSAEGLLRGASQAQIYNAKRATAAEPTRLFIDAIDEQAWRALDFYSVTKKQDASPSLMQSMIDLGRHRSDKLQSELADLIRQRDIKLGRDYETQCPKPDSFSDYRDERPHGGMPLAVTGLTEKEHRTLSAWLNQGAQVDTASWTISDADQKMITQWETWLNQSDNNSRLLARYLYEHLFLAHLYLADDNSMHERLSKPSTPNPSVQFYRLVRSQTKPGKAIIPINTRRPNNAPDTPFFYRLMPVEQTLMYKSHITYRFDERRKQELKHLFKPSKWDVKDLPGYNYRDRANPFLTFSDIPVKARYQFLLQDAEYFIRTFIRGPVCHGPIATDVIRDHFWVMFEDPNSELFTNNPNYEKSAAPLLALPGENDDILDFTDEWTRYKEKRDQYIQLRQKHHAKRFPKGRPLENLWHANDQNPNAFLTVFRHHDSASVTRGWHGDWPLTAWVMDYPLFERSYYELVVGFDVFGNLSHQLQTRLYFDLIRHGGETNFLSFLPPKQRLQHYEQWYSGLAKLKTGVSYPEPDNTLPGSPSLQDEASMQTLLMRVMRKHPNTSQAYDPLNRPLWSKNFTAGNEAHISEPVRMAFTELSSTPQTDLPFIEHLPDLTVVLVQSTGEDQIVSLIRNRRHSNVAFMFGESLRYEKEKDTLSAVHRLIGSYPNLILRVDETDLSNMVEQLKGVDSRDTFLERMRPYILHRLDPDFWTTLHAIADANQSTYPLEGGLLDINRYGYW